MLQHIFERGFIRADTQPEIALWRRERRRKYGLPA
jgi:hypothetical protein